MPNTYVIIGNPNTGKSSLIRALSGVRIEKIVQIKQLNGSIIDVFVKVKSLQESEEDEIDAVRKYGNYDNILIALWERAKSGRKKQYPDANGYLTEFIRVGWHIQSIAVLGQSVPNLPPNLPSSVLVTPRTVASPIPVNEMASQVRPGFGWV